MISRDPLNLTIFTDAAWSLYRQAKDFTGTMNLHGVLGACPASLSENKTMSMPDGRLGEIARTALYLADTYHLPMPDNIRKRFISIHEYSPPSTREYYRNKIAYRINRTWNAWIEKKPTDIDLIKKTMTDKLDILTYRALIREDYN